MPPFFNSKQTHTHTLTLFPHTVVPPSLPPSPLSPKAKQSKVEKGIREKAKKRVVGLNTVHIILHPILILLHLHQQNRMTSRLTQNGINGTHHHPQYYPHPTSSSSSKASFKGCCCCLFLLFSFLLLLILAVILVIVLAVKPKKPQFDLQQVGVQYVGITPNPATIATSSASVSLNIRMVFTAFNDNKVGIKYGESRFTIMYRGIPLGRGSVPAFYQPAHSVKRVETTIVVDRVNLLQADAADLIRDAALNDRVELRVLGDVGAKIRILGFTSPGVEVSVDCAIVISPRKQALTYKQCGFDGLSV